MGITKHIPALRVFQVLADGLRGKLYRQGIVVFALLIVSLLDLAANHGQVPQHIDVGLVVLETALEALATGWQVVLLPVDVAQSGPGLLLGRLELERLGQVVFGLLAVLGHKVEHFPPEVQQVRLSFFVLVLLLDWLGV